MCVCFFLTIALKLTIEYYSCSALADPFFVAKRKIVQFCRMELFVDTAATLNSVVSGSYYGMLRGQFIHTNYILITHWPDSALKSLVSMVAFFQRGSFTDFNIKPTQMLFERFKTKSLHCYVLPGELVEFPVIRNNTPSRDEVRKDSWTLNSAFKLKLSTNKREHLLFSFLYYMSSLKNAIYI